MIQNNEFIFDKITKDLQRIFTSKPHDEEKRKQLYSKEFNLDIFLDDLQESYLGNIEEKVGHAAYNTSYASLVGD